VARKTNRELEEENASLKEQLAAVADVLEDDAMKDGEKLDEIEDVIFDEEAEEE
jgi:uncharacterized protein YrrD